MALSSVRATHSASKMVAATCTNPSRVDRALSNRAAPAARRNKVLALGSVPVADSDMNTTSGNTEEKRTAVYRQLCWCARFAAGVRFCHRPQAIRQRADTENICSLNEWSVMHIQHSAVQLSSLQQQATLASRVRSASVTETTNGNNPRGAALPLSRETREQQALQSSSQVSLGDEQTRYHSQQFLAQQLTESVTNLKVDISKLHSQVQEDRNGVRVEIRQITEVESAQQLSFEALGQ